MLLNPAHAIAPLPWAFWELRPVFRGSWKRWSKVSRTSWSTSMTCCCTQGDKGAPQASESGALSIGLQQNHDEPQEVRLWDKLKAVAEFQPPSNTREVGQFLGVCNFFRAHIKDIAKMYLLLTASQLFLVITFFISDGNNVVLHICVSIIPNSTLTTLFKLRPFPMPLPYRNIIYP